jgi:hypothetical protein
MAGRLVVSTLNNDTGVLNVQNGMTGIAKAWVNFTGSTSPSIQNSFNVSSVTYNGTGDFTITFTTAMPNANSVGAGFARISGNGGFVQMASNTPFTTTTFNFGTAVNGGGQSNPIITGVVVFNS